VARIRITTFGGVQPSVDPRNLPADSGQTAQNLDLRWGDFRPLRGPGASVSSVPAGTISIHRTPSGVWLSSTTDADFVDGQDDGSSIERVYITGRSAYPEIWQAGTYRRLGVPRPASAPTVVVNSTSEFSTDQRSVAYRALVDSMLATAEAQRTEVPLGGGTPATALSAGSIWLAHGADSELPTTSWRQICFCVPITTGPLATVVASETYLLDPSLGGKQINYLGTNYWAVPLTWQARGYEFDTVAMSTAYEALMAPPDNTSPLFDAAEADYAAGLIAAPFVTTSDPAATYIEGLDAAQTTVVNLLAGTENNTQRAFALVTAASSMRNASQRVEDYYTNTNKNLRSLVESSLNAYDWKLPVAVDRTFETRFYRHTYVTDRGEESAPSDPSSIATLDQNDSAGITIAAAAVGAPYGTLTHWRLYRSSTTQTGQAWQLVAEIAIGTLTYTDTKLQEQLTDVLVTETWEEPRADLFALHAMPNGILVGLADAGKTLCFCEPGAPYAWPREYEIPLQYAGVGIGGFGQTAVVVTIGLPYYVSGADSASMSAQKIEAPQACASKRSIVSAEGGVFYASPDGLCLAGPSGVQVLTLQHYSPEDWRALGLAGSFGCFSEGVYRLVTEN
jgi:hypothetical protein